jgi:rhodanese-related sulfurtransferase
MKRYTDLVNECLPEVKELFPWDLEEKLQQGDDMLLVDIREPYEYEAMHIRNSINIPRGVLESAADWDYEETVPELVKAREREVVLICRSGNRSVLAAKTLQLMGFHKVVSLKTGLRGWNDYEQPLVDGTGAPVTFDQGDDYFLSRVRPDQLAPHRR